MQHHHQPLPPTTMAAAAATPTGITTVDSLTPLPPPPTTTSSPSEPPRQPPRGHHRHTLLHHVTTTTAAPSPPPLPPNHQSAKVKRYISGLPDMIHDSVKASKPQSMQEAIEFATEMMDKKMLTHAEHQAEHKKKFNDTSRNTQHQQQPPKRNNVARAYTASKEIRSLMEGPNLYVSSRPTAANNNNNNQKNNNNNNQKAQGATARGITCYECGVLEHYKSDCPKLKNGNKGNRAGNGNVVARAYVVGTTGTNPNSNVVTGVFLLNNRYASVLFDTGADRSFVSTVFSSLIDIIPTTLDHGYDVELVDDRIIWVNTLIRGCTLNFQKNPFNIDLMPVEMGSFDVIIGMDWLVKY
nr:hypothetical protein [Tanacetum cinerariifolium]